MKRILIHAALLISSFSGFSQPAKVEPFDQSGISISEVPINTGQNNFGATLVEDTLFFSSDKNGGGNKRGKKQNQPKFYAVFKAGINQNGCLSEGRVREEEFSTGCHVGSVNSWCTKTSELFLTQSNIGQIRYTPFPIEYNNLKISIAKKIGQKWEIIEEFPFNGSDYSVGHPAISELGDTLVFASDMPGGVGATDLYLSVRTNGKWRTPVNLGSRINTTGNEEFPFLVRNSKGETYLVFSSDKSGGMGGFDIYYTKIGDQESQIESFNSPINSSHDDFAMSFSLERGFGYFSSNRKSSGDDNIYMFTFKE